MSYQQSGFYKESDTMSTLREALAQGRYYPAFIRLETEIADHVPPLALAEAYAHCLREAALGATTRYTVPDMKADDAPGTQVDLEHELRRLGPEEAFAFRMITKDKTELGSPVVSAVGQPRASKGIIRPKPCPRWNGWRP